MSKSIEINFDGLIGPTHNFAGLAFGNIASSENKFSISHPKKAALQGLAKMKLLHSLGVKQGFIPPQERPNIRKLKDIGYKGPEKKVLIKAATRNFQDVLFCSSASSMWVANAATVSPSKDTADGKVHITPANLTSHPHRAMETLQTAKVLKQIFPEDRFVHHDPLEEFLLDEGAANHLRFEAHDNKGVEVFVYGTNGGVSPQHFPARQMKKASEQIAKNHLLEDVIFVQQNPDVIDKGVFHNDVISVSNENVFLYHERAFLNSNEFIDQLKKKIKDLILIEIKDEQLIVEAAVMSYLFNSQIVTLPNKQMCLIAPEECRESKIKAVIDRIIEEKNPITEVKFVELNESMANGGGPACLRLRVLVTEEELKQVNQNFILNDKKFELLEEWINAYYRDELHINDLKNYYLLEESREALNELTHIMNLGNIYSFQIS